MVEDNCNSYPPAAAQAVLQESMAVPDSTLQIRGWDFNKGCDLDSLLGSMLGTGFQASALGQAILEVNRMIHWRLPREHSEVQATHAASPESDSHGFPAPCPGGKGDENSVFLGTGLSGGGASACKDGASSCKDQSNAASFGNPESQAHRLTSGAERDALPHLQNGPGLASVPNGAGCHQNGENKSTPPRGGTQGTGSPLVTTTQPLLGALEVGDAPQTVTAGGPAPSDSVPPGAVPAKSETAGGGDDSPSPGAEEQGSMRCKIFLGYTSNLISSGVREHIRYLVQHRMVDVVVTTAGGIEEDLIKCLGPTYAGDFQLAGAELRKKGLNRVGNLLVPNSNYCAFEDWVMPILDAMLDEQLTRGTLWSPSKVIERLGKEIGNPDSVCYWAWRNQIPIFCPGLTDGSLGDMIFFHTYKSDGLVIDIVSDIRRMNDQAMKAAAPQKTGVIILGGGLPKHHICNANLMRNGADFAVYINTAQEYDGSDSGARPDEAVSWGKIRADATPVKVVGDATILFPLLLSQTFFKAASSFPGPAPHAPAGPDTHA